MYWECEPNEKAYLSTKFKDWFEKNPPPPDTLTNIQKRLDKDRRKSSGASKTPLQSVMSAFLNGTKVNYGSYFTGKVSHVTAAMAVKLHRKDDFKKRNTWFNILSNYIYVYWIQL